jgi:hypothetical protein
MQCEPSASPPGKCAGFARTGKQTIFPHAEACEEIRPAWQALRRVRAAFCVAEEMGESVGRGQILLGPLPEGAEMIAISQVNSPLRKRI